MTLKPDSSADPMDRAFAELEAENAALREELRVARETAAGLLAALEAAWEQLNQLAPRADSSFRADYVAVWRRVKQVIADAQAATRAAQPEPGSDPAFTDYVHEKYAGALEADIHDTRPDFAPPTEAPGHESIHRLTGEGRC